MLLFTAVIVIWGYIGFQIESASSTHQDQAVRESGTEVDTAVLKVVQGESEYYTDFDDPFDMSQLDETRSQFDAEGTVDNSPEAQHTTAFPKVELLGLVGSTAIVSTDTQTGILRSPGDSLDSGTVASVFAQRISIQLPDTLIELTVAVNAGDNFTIKKTE
ncbi:MAG: hypothetical protein HKN43_10780 [Rhodothermales bacterium]|nr:hypothetical protein [Rhodothermales bacterium]